MCQPSQIASKSQPIANYVRYLIGLVDIRVHWLCQPYQIASKSLPIARSGRYLLGLGHIRSIGCANHGKRRSNRFPLHVMTDRYLIGLVNIRVHGLCQPYQIASKSLPIARYDRYLLCLVGISVHWLCQPCQIASNRFPLHVLFDICYVWLASGSIVCASHGANSEQTVSPLHVLLDI